MKGKLIKRTNERYDLYYSEDINQLNTIASTQHEPNIGKLSIQNCQVIENGYDLDELAKDYAINQLANPNEYEHSIYAATIQNTYMVGFQKALELLGDKKFSEKDVHHALHLMNNQGRLAYIDNALEMVKKSTEQRDNIIQSLKQNEWDVEVEMECGCNGKYLTLNGTNSICCGDIRPKLDADSCLIFNKI